MRAVAGRGGLARVQEDILALPKGRRESEQRVYWARSRGFRIAVGWSRAILRCSRRSYSTSLKGAFGRSPPHTHTPESKLILHHVMSMIRLPLPLPYAHVLERLRADLYNIFFLDLDRQVPHA